MAKEVVREAFKKDLQDVGYSEDFAKKVAEESDKIELPIGSDTQVDLVSERYGVPSELPDEPSAACGLLVLPYVIASPASASAVHQSHKPK
jgi:hypothetical protein